LKNGDEKPIRLMIALVYPAYMAITHYRNALINGGAVEAIPEVPYFEEEEEEKKEA
jgi:hypothetical protein